MGDEKKVYMSLLNRVRVEEKGVEEVVQEVFEVKKIEKQESGLLGMIT